MKLLILFIGFAFFNFGHDFMYRMHGRMYRISVETFDAIHDAGMVACKIAIMVMNITPYIAHRLATQHAIYVAAWLQVPRAHAVVA